MIHKAQKYLVLLNKVDNAFKDFVDALVEVDY